MTYISSKLEEFDEFCDRYNVGGKARLALRAFITQAEQEAYLAGQQDPFYGESVATVGAREQIRTEAQQETAKEILADIGRMTVLPVEYSDERHEWHDSALTKVADLISSKFLHPAEDSTNKDGHGV